ncbi:MAG: hypothetical protein GXX83_07655 [Gaiellales bacterium]|nr:hypothetical protein [Gaiellales bacterium]
MREEVWVPGPHRLEGILEAPDPGAVEGGAVPGGAVVSHAHPLYGGSMTLPVVHHAAKGCREAGLATLRFNFRGVGRSEGLFHGTDEARDVMAAAAFLGTRVGSWPLVLAGYSFGASMSMLAAVELKPAALILVAFPLVFETLEPFVFSRIGEYEGPVLALCGTEDQIALPGRVEAFLKERGLSAEMTVLDGADHLFGGRQALIERTIGDFLQRALNGKEAAGGEA